MVEGRKDQASKATSVTQVTPQSDVGKEEERMFWARKTDDRMELKGPTVCFPGREMNYEWRRVGVTHIHHGDGWSRYRRYSVPLFLVKMPPPPPTR